MDGGNAYVMHDRNFTQEKKVIDDIITEFNKEILNLEDSINKLPNYWKDEASELKIKGFITALDDIKTAVKELDSTAHEDLDNISASLTVKYTGLNA